MLNIFNIDFSPTNDSCQIFLTYHSLPAFNRFFWMSTIYYVYLLMDALYLFRFSHLITQAFSLSQSAIAR